MPPQLPIKYKRQALKFIEGLQTKQKQQLLNAVASLRIDPVPPDCIKIYDEWRRKSVGEYRIVYKVDIDTKKNNQEYLLIRLAGKRNDDEIYRLASRAGL